MASLPLLVPVRLAESARFGVAPCICITSTLSPILKGTGLAKVKVVVPEGGQVKAPPAAILVTAENWLTGVKHAILPAVVCTVIATSENELHPLPEIVHL